MIMDKVGIFYGSDSGNLKESVEMLQNMVGKNKVDLYDVAKNPEDKLSEYEKFIFASSTFGTGDLQADWEDFIDKVESFDFTGKTIAIIGMGDQETYEDTFCNCMFLIYEKVKEGNIVGFTSTEGYSFTDSESVIDGKFIGLALDRDTQDELTESRINNWIKEIKDDFGF